MIGAGVFPVRWSATKLLGKPAKGVMYAKMATGDNPVPEPYVYTKKNGIKERRWYGSVGVGEFLVLL